MTTTPKKSKRQIEREIAEILARPHEHLVYRTVGADGDPWPDWLVATQSSCGVYVIREKGGEPLYAGSSNKALYGTITRHFQQWKRSKQFWKGYKSEGSHTHATSHDPGLTYNRSECEVGIRVMVCGEELEEEAALIQRLRPRDNMVARPDGGGLEDVPF